MPLKFSNNIEKIFLKIGLKKNQNQKTQKIGSILLKFSLKSCRKKCVVLKQFY